jgi:molybdopterin synthase sulfur carrier subunit
MVKVRIPTPLRPLTGGKGEVETQAADIQSMIDSLNGQFPGLKGRICDEAGEIRRFVNIYLNEEDIRFLSGKETLIKDGDQISIVPAIAGGEEESVLADSRAGGCHGGQEVCPGHPLPSVCNGSKRLQGWVGEMGAQKSVPREKDPVLAGTGAGGCNGGAS